MHRHVYELLDRINRTKSLAEIYNAALDSISSALKCDRASILLFDASGVMRFAAWKGLSDGYRQAVDGHSPWSDGSENPQTITVPNLDSFDLEADLRAVIQAEGIQSLAFVPLLYGGKLLGKFMVYYSAPHDFTGEELGLAQAIAAEIAFAIQRHHDHEAMRAGEERYRRLFNAIDQGFCVIEVIFDGDGKPVDYRFLEVNAAFEEQTGLVNAVGQTVRELAPEHEEHWFEIYGRVARTGEPVRFQNRAQALARWYDVYAFRVAPPESRSIAVLFTDITVSKRAEQELRESERRFRAVFNQQFQFMAVLSPEGKLVEVNELPLRSTGIARHEVIGRLFWETPWWKDLPEMRVNWPKRLADAARSDGPVLSQDQYQTADGQIRTAAAAITAVKDARGEVEFFIVQASDITEREASEKALRESESRQRAILNSALDCIITIDHDSKIVAVNKAFEITFGFGREEVLGRSMAELIIPERYRKAHYQGLGRYVATGQGVLLNRRVELTALRRDGTEFPVELGIVPIERQGPPLFTGTLRDITERKRNEGALAQAHAELRRHANELEDRVRERTASLDESLKSLETLLYTIAHDLRAPNRAMQGYAQLLTQGYADKLDDEGRFFVDRISQAAIRNERLIRDLLEFGRLVHAELPCRLMNPEAAIAGVLTALESEIKASGGTVQVASPWPEVCANDSTLTHALSNLVLNALKYVEPGARPQVRLFPKTLPGKVRICVQDNGIGVAPDQHQRIFEPFQRAAGVKYEGTGMGLAIVRKAAERMGGTAGVESVPGEGSCFWVELSSGSGPP